MQLLIAAICVLVIMLSGMAVVQVEGVTAMRSAYTQSTRVTNESNYYGLNSTQFQKARQGVDSLLTGYETAILNDPAALARLEANQPPIEITQAPSFFASIMPFQTTPLDGLVGLSPISGPARVGNEMIEGLNKLNLKVNGQVRFLRISNSPLVDNPGTPVNEATAFSPWLYELQFVSQDESVSLARDARYQGMREFRFTFRAVKSASTVVPARPVEPQCATFNACSPPAPPVVPPPTPPAYPTYSTTVERQ